MVVDPEIQKIYKEIQKQLFYMIPEKWNKVYLYSSINENQAHSETGELYFYYIPKGVLKKNPINVYEIPYKFNIDENQYLKLVERLYQKIKRLQDMCIQLGEERWNSIIISIANFEFKVEYKYDYINFNSFEKHLIFRYVYLNYPISSFSKAEKKVIQKYLTEKEYNKSKTKIYSEIMYEMPFETIEIGSKNSNIQYVKEDDIRLLEESKEIKSQILKQAIKK